jgi:AcrR family transcriptional regulator
LLIGNTRARMKKRHDRSSKKDRSCYNAAMPRHRHGHRRREQILGAARDLASAEGLEGLSIARLATETGMSKSGVFAHFGSKEALQQAAIDAAAADFEHAVLRPTEQIEPGRARLEALIEAWIRHVEQTPLRGGCFFFATSSEFASRSGAVRATLAERTATWLRLLEREARTAVRTGELDVDPALLSFRLHAYVQEANWMRQLHDDERAFEHARHAAAEAIEAAARPRVRATPPTQVTQETVP